MIFVYFVITNFFKQLMSNLPLKIPTFSKITPTFRRNFSHKKQKIHQTFQHFRLFKKMKMWFIFDENLPDFVGTTADSKAKSRDTMSFNFCSLSLKKLRQFDLTCCYQNMHFFEIIGTTCARQSRHYFKIFQKIRIFVRFC